MRASTRRTVASPGGRQAPVASRLNQGVFEQGLAWASELVQATSALLTPEAGGYVVFDYLLDSVQADPNAATVPSRIWEHLLSNLQLEDARAVGVAAYEAGEYQVAERAWQVAADAGDHVAEFNLGVLSRDLGQVEKAEHWWRRSYGRKLWMSPSHESAAYLPP
jgi:tetratricopeptide (TPR) repeat protein